MTIEDLILVFKDNDHVLDTFSDLFWTLYSQGRIKDAINVQMLSYGAYEKDGYVYVRE